MAKEPEPAGAKAEPMQAQVSKADFEELKKRLDLAEAKNAQLENENKATKDALAKEATARILKEHIEKAEKLYPQLGAPGELALITKGIAEKAPEEWAKLEGILKAASERIAKGELFSEIGSRGSGPASGSAEEQLTSIAKSYVEKDPKLDYPMAFTKACQDNEELYDRYVAEQRGL